MPSSERVALRFCQWSNVVLTWFFGSQPTLLKKQDGITEYPSGCLTLLTYFAYKVNE